MREREDISKNIRNEKRINQKYNLYLKIISEIYE